MRCFAGSLAVLLLSACAQSAQPPIEESSSTAPAAVAKSTTEPVVEAEPVFPMMVVHKSATCGCCGEWVEYMQAAGFTVEVRNADNIHPVKERVGVPLTKGSCHTAEIDGYFIEGHVPADDVKRLLSERPDAKGLVLPGMPAGSPGMEMPDGRTEPYTVELVHRDGSVGPFASH